MGGILTQTNDTKCYILNTPRDLQPTSVRRSNFQGDTLTAGSVITEPQLFTGMHDMEKRHIDTWTKINYFVVEDMSLDLNFTLNIQQYNNWGYQTNGSFDGLVGALQRQEVDLGATGMLFKADRMMVMDYIGETYHFRATILFRQPSLASVTNIFLQPFSSGVWMCALIMFSIKVVALTVEMKLEWQCQKDGNCRKMRHLKPKKDPNDWGEVVMMVIGAVCQQGFYSPPSSLSARITFLVLWMASLFLFTSYAANVVALLQTPSHLVQSLSDLIKVPMEVGIQDVIYNRVYFRETTDSLAKELYHTKIEPYHERAYYNAVEGMQRVQKGLFAFQVEHTIGYKVISETFTVEEKCGLGNVELIRTPLLGIPIARDSPYKEILSQKLLHLREVGVLDRTFKQWVPQKPSCTNSHHSTSRQFVSIGLEELWSSFSLLWAGAIAALSLLFLENLIRTYSRKRKRFHKFMH
ncbi:glutamate receptor ionotropic, kainate glr-3-like [Ischnura elegans]|uniref:glutamate receptor ionotropic, kainate glr-3-like n=1 Tax=Ischnura elegans TaxID=197161 RepID=UPI001ED88C92|nr:glutamate receptor ionotropic, kainate glr-3-like [Ischnura elegans]